MALSDSLILEGLEKGTIIIDGFNRDYLNPCSVDLTIAPELKTYIRETQKCHITKAPDWVLATGHCVFHSDDIIEYEVPLDVKRPNLTASFVMPETGFVLVPNEVYLYSCNERIGVKGNIRAKVEGKSSLGRLGLDIHITAGFIDPGFEGSLVLELSSRRPIRIYPNMKICQIEFTTVEGEILESYDAKAGSKYHNQSGVQESLMHKNFESNDNK